MAMVGILQTKALLKRLDEINAAGTLDGANADRSENLHRLFMYPAMMVPVTQSIIIEAISHVCPNEAWAIDPFMGSGTSLMSCMEFGFNVFGQDINPFSVLLTKAKIFSFDMVGYEKTYVQIKQHIESDTDQSIAVSFKNIDKWFNKRTQIGLSKIRRAIQCIEIKSFRYYYWTIYAEAIRIGGNDRTSTFKMHCRSVEELKRRDIDIIKEFLVLAKRGFNDINNYRIKLEKCNLLIDNKYSRKTNIIWGNTQKAINSDLKFDLLVSSPPYGDNHTTVTYGQTSYLPLQWIDKKDLDCPYDYLRTSQEIDRQSLGGRIDRKVLKEEIYSLMAKSKVLRDFYQSIPDGEKHKYYKTLSFIKDFDESLDQIIAKMKSDAFYVWTIGNRNVGGREIPNDDILLDLMMYHGIDLFYQAERKILNKMQPRRNNFSKTMEKEQIFIFHRKEN